jgi:hypothetical protein
MPSIKPMNQKIKQNWERNVGRFILDTGMIELRLLQLYWNISPDGSYDVAIKKHTFAEKIKRVKKKSKPQVLVLL